MKRAPLNFLGIFMGCLLIHNVDVNAGSGGKNSLPFLNLGMGARPLGMAGAFTAVADDVNSLFYNPAGLSGIQTVQVSLLYHRWLADTSYSYLALAKPIRNVGTIAGSVFYLGAPPIQGFDEFNQATGSFSANNMAFALSFGRNIGKGFSAGFSTKMVREVIDTESVNVFSLDLGVLYRTESNIQAGLFLGNMGGQVKHLSDTPVEASKQAGIFRAGLSGLTQDSKFLGSIEFTKQFDDDPELKIGSEYRFSDEFAARIGYSHELGGRMVEGFSGLAAGVGIRLSSMQIDYAISPWGDLGLTHVVGLTYAGLVREEPRPLVREKEPISPELTEKEMWEAETPPEKKLISLSGAVELLRQGRTRDGLNALAKLAKKDPRNAQVYLYTGLGLKAMDRNEDAQSYFKAAYKFSKEGSRTRRLAEGYLDRGPQPKPKIAEPVQIINPTPVPRVEPKVGSETLSRAVDLLKSGNAKESLKMLTVLSKRQPRDPTIFLYTGLALKSMGRTEDARRYFEATIKLSPAGSKVSGYAETYLADL